ncbi:hypothetical protein CSAL01_02457 [Colletotrichum salicis]|uniref:Uncharacterized protein n=1 Tax=Colletotrichum salicis TaxID=1209931 RepID=A0A135RYE2_9PEZI|nr:hypothetical protein CSAL01_02457 [Colletotrichum salicis]
MLQQIQNRPDQPNQANSLTVSPLATAPNPSMPPPPGTATGNHLVCWRDSRRGCHWSGAVHLAPERYLILTRWHGWEALRNNPPALPMTSQRILVATFGKMGTIQPLLRGVPLFSDSNLDLYITLKFAPIHEATNCSPDLRATETTSHLLTLAKQTHTQPSALTPGSGLDKTVRVYHYRAYHHLIEYGQHDIKPREPHSGLRKYRLALAAFGQPLIVTPDDRFGWLRAAVERA